MAFGPVSVGSTLKLTAESIRAALGYDLTAKLNDLEKELERKMNMEAKLVYTGTGSVDGFKNVTLTLPSGVDYVVVRMIQPFIKSDTDTPIAAAADYGSTRIVRGGTAAAPVGDGSDSTTVTFAADGTLTFARTSGSATRGFNVEGYQYQ